MWYNDIRQQLCWGIYNYCIYFRGMHAYSWLMNKYIGVRIVWSEVEKTHTSNTDSHMILDVSIELKFPGEC